MNRTGRLIPLLVLALSLVACTNSDPTAEDADAGAAPSIGAAAVDGCGEATASTEIFDPTTQRFVEGPAMSVPRAGHTATSLPNGRVAMAGGGRTGESYDPTTGGISPLAGPSGRRLSFATATLLEGGSLLAVGGYDKRIDLLRPAYLIDRL